MPVPPTELLGRWSFERRVHDRRAGRFGHVRGAMDFAADGDAVRWSEHGEFCWDGRRFEVSRELTIVPSGDGWTVRFADGHEFHPWQPGRVVTHPCRADVYRGIVSVGAGSGSFRVLWDVTGPAKDQRLLTRARRAGVGSSGVPIV